MEIIMMPTTDIGSLCEEVNRKYGWQLDDYDLCQILFGKSIIIIVISLIVLIRT